MSIVSSVRQKIKSKLWRIGLKMYSKLLSVAEIFEEIKKNSICYGSKPASSRLSRKATVIAPSMLYLGENVHIGDGCYLDARGTITIGSNTHVSRNVAIYSINHDIDSGIPYRPGDILKEVIIERNVWIGMNVSIAPGSYVKEGAVIGMGAVVSGVIPAHAIVASPKARVIKHRDLDKYNENIFQSRIGGINGNLDLPLADCVHQYPIDFYVLGAGRSGTTALAKLLSQNPEIDCRHESLKQLFQITERLLHNQVAKSEAHEKIEFLIRDSEIARSTAPVRGESSQRLSCIVPLLSQTTPQAKFIAVIRKAEHAVSSMYSRGWFSDEELAMHHSKGMVHPTFWQITRVHADKMNIMTHEEWRSLGQFGRCCWYWNYWNNMIIDSLEDINKPSLIMLIDLLSVESLLYAQDYLGCTKAVSIVPEIYNRSLHELYQPEDWSRIEKGVFNRLCNSREMIIEEFDPLGILLTKLCDH
jgi:acetyltransferase-like isoleucine patch superfamily enzyme